MKMGIERAKRPIRSKKPPARYADFSAGRNRRRLAQEDSSPSSDRDERGEGVASPPCHGWPSPIQQGVGGEDPAVAAVGRRLNCPDFPQPCYVGHVHEDGKDITEAVLGEARGEVDGGIWRLGDRRQVQGGDRVLDEVQGLHEPLPSSPSSSPVPDGASQSPGLRQRVQGQVDAVQEEVSVEVTEHQVQLLLREVRQQVEQEQQDAAAHEVGGEVGGEEQQDLSLIHI